MSEKFDKWSMFKNYMANELNITKEDIQQWLEEAIEVEAIKLVKNTFRDRSPEKMIEDALIKSLSREHKDFYDYTVVSDFIDKVVEEVSKGVLERLNITIKS